MDKNKLVVAMTAAAIATPALLTAAFAFGKAKGYANAATVVHDTLSTFVKENSDTATN